MPDTVADAYFATRPRGAQLGAWASDKSEPLADRATLQMRVAEVTQTYEGREIPRPPHRRRYRVSLDRIEFWQGRSDRLHDRMVYTRDAGGGWRAERLYP